MSEGRKYPDGTVVRVFCLQTDRDAYPSGWAYTLHYGATEPDPPRTLADGTIQRYDNSHETPKDTNCTSHRIPTRRLSSFPEWSNSGNGSGARFRNPSSRSREAVDNSDTHERYHAAAAPDGARTASG